jgi:FkbM family methyltransferase
LIKKFSKGYLLKKNGIYIECGASDGITYSNSFLLEQKYGWTGLLVEPIQDQFDALVRYRKNSICAKYILTSSEDSGKKINIVNAGPESIIIDEQIENLSMTNTERMSLLDSQKMIKGEESVKSISISELLDKYNIKEVDIFFLDVEGSEISVLNGLDTKKHKIKNIVVETGSIDSFKDYMYTIGFDKCENIARNDFIFYSSSN